MLKMLSTATHAWWISALALVALAGPGCRGTGDGYGSSGCGSCQRTSVSPAAPTGFDVPGGSPELTAQLAPIPDRSSSVAAVPRTCPVTGAALGSMGEPVPVTVSGKTVHVCCAGCVGKLKQNPGRYLNPDDGLGGEL